MYDDSTRDLERLDTTRASNSTVCADGGTSWADLTGFQRDLLVAISRIEGDGYTPYGTAIKNRLENIRDEEVNHGRLYPNLDTLENLGLIDKSPLDRRANEYALRAAGSELIIQQVDRLAEAAGVENRVATDGGAP